MKTWTLAAWVCVAVAVGCGGDDDVDVDAGRTTRDGGGSVRDGGGTSTTDGGVVSATDSGGHDGGTTTGAVWHPTPRTTWQWQLTGALDTTIDVAMYDIDLFETTPAQIDALHADGRIVICYFSAGSHEDFRDDADDFPTSAVGMPLDGWPGERWLDVRDATVRAIMQTRLDVAVTKRCDGVEPDNVDGYANDTGFPLSEADQLDYDRFLAREAHARSLSVGLKNDVDQVDDLVADFDWALNEECHMYDECDTLAPFIDAGKAVFHVEYGGMGLASTVCPATMPLGFSTLIKRLELDAWRVACP